MQTELCSWMSVARLHLGYISLWKLSSPPPSCKEDASAQITEFHLSPPALCKKRMGEKSLLSQQLSGLQLIPHRVLFIFVIDFKFNLKMQQMSSKHKGAQLSTTHYNAFNICLLDFLLSCPGLISSPLWSFLPQSASLLWFNKEGHFIL